MFGYPNFRFLSNNQLIGPFPNLTGLNLVSYLLVDNILNCFFISPRTVKISSRILYNIFINMICRDLSNNSFDSSSVPSSFSTLQALTSLYVFLLHAHTYIEVQSKSRKKFRAKFSSC